MNRKKTCFVKPDLTAESQCPHCGATVLFDVESQHRPGPSVRAWVRCDCGHAHAVYLERRAALRKQVDLLGSYRVCGDSTEQPMRVRDVSRTGLNFEPDDLSRLTVGTRLEVEFSFGNGQHTSIDKQVRVLRRADGTVGADFYDGRSSDPLDMACHLALAQYQPATQPFAGR